MRQSIAGFGTILNAAGIIAGGIGGKGHQIKCSGFTYSSPACIHQLLRIFVKECGLELENALNFVTVNLAKLFRPAATKGGILEGADADLNIYDSDMNIESVFTKGKPAGGFCNPFRYETGLLPYMFSNILMEASVY